MLQVARKYTTKSVKKHKRVGIVAAKLGGKIVAPMEYGGTMDRLLFETGFVQHFLPVIKKRELLL